MEYSIGVCLAAFFCLLWIVRRSSFSLGLPVAYLFSLLLIHVPGAYAHLVTNWLPHTDVVAFGIYFTAIGAVSFVAGVLAVRMFKLRPKPAVPNFDERAFSIFCLFGGWFFTYALSPLQAFPSIGAAVERAGAIWMLGVMLGLRAAVRHADLKMIALWLSALAVYPVLMLLLGGFVSYGSAAVIIVMSILTVSVESRIKVVIGVIVAVFLSLNIFVNYFAHRAEIRAEVWGGAPLADRIDRTLDVVRDFEWFSADNRRQVYALDQRLNQNYFAGLSALRIEQGLVDYLYGRSLWEGAIALIPRALWPEKPVVAGSPKIVGEMTGLQLNQNTSFGVGNVMEFQINFGIPGLIVGFFVLGLLLRLLDRSAATAVNRGDYGSAILFFLPALSLIQPNGSMVELCGGAAAAWVGAHLWKLIWQYWSAREGPRARRLAPRPLDPRFPRR